ncbi:MAG: arylsulfatase [Parabacteroides gordonii]|uniref:arylsulfatase n=1 Tax=Parabacteroides gordonii TaxID=574930 RepID=UPI003A884EDC
MKHFLYLFFPLSAATLLSVSLQAQDKQTPNVVFILADDMGIGDLGCYGQQKIKTPHIDAMAAGGLLFQNHYSGSTVSAPSRCCLMTGKHTGHAYVRGNKRTESKLGYFDLHLPESETTVAELFKQKGYATMCVGKWGLGGPETSGSPVRKGFNYFFGYLSQSAAHRYYPEYLYENEKKVMLNGKVYSHFMIMEKGLDFIRKNQDKPFFAYFAITPPHADLDYPDLSEYENSFDETPFENPGFEKGKGNKPQSKPRATYAAMVSEVDKNVGQIVDLLKETGQLANTIIIFASDNGVHNVGGHDPAYFNSNASFRGIKRDLYEGGVHVPFVVSWPAVIKKPRTTDHIATFWDFMPTICDLLDIPVPNDSDGISYLPVLENREENQHKHDYLYYEFYEQGGKQSIYKDGWKLVRLNMNNPAKTVEELYYLPDDRREKKDLSSLHPEKVHKLKRLMSEAHTDSDQYSWKTKNK